MCSTAARIGANRLQMAIHDVGVHVAQRGMTKCLGKASDDFKFEALPQTHGALVLTTKLNCMARKSRSFARSMECAHIARATPRPVAEGAVMYPQFATCPPPPFWFARRKYVPTILPFSSATKSSCSVERQNARAVFLSVSRGNVYVSPARRIGSMIAQIPSSSPAAARRINMRVSCHDSAWPTLFHSLRERDSQTSGP